jgi:GlpG protein
MSGVLFGFFGFIWMKSTFEPGSGFYISPNMLIFITIFLVFGLTKLDEQFLGAPIDNWAHIVGMLTGMVIGYAPVLFKRLRSP